MRLIIGLGNPGRKYKKTRHNVGFRVLDEFRKQNSFPNFKMQKKFQAEVSEGLLNKEKTILVKPQTFMNNSGRAVRALVNFYKIPLENLVVVHDELDLPIGEIKMSEDKGSAGHNGVQSIINELGSQAFNRLRIGISDPNSAISPEKFVLQKFSKPEQKILKSVVQKSCNLLKQN